MATTDENKAIRSQQSREVARDAAEAYRAAVAEVEEAARQNRQAMAALDAELLTRADRDTRRRALREEARSINEQGFDLGLDRARMHRLLGVSRETIHNWLNGKKW